MKLTRHLSMMVSVEADGDTVAEVFERLAQLEEVFTACPSCGLCKSDRITYRVRLDAEGNKYYEAVCLACRGEFRFGQRRTPAGVLFPQLKDGSGNIKPDGGWIRYEQMAGRAAAQPHNPPVAQDDTATVQRAEDYFRGKLDKVLTPNDLNILIQDLGGFVGAAKHAAWNVVKTFAAQRQWAYDAGAKRFSISTGGPRR